MAETLSLSHLSGQSAFSSARSAPPRITTLAVPDMHCGGCMRKVEQALQSVPGVSSARANLSAKRVTVVAAAEATDSERFLSTLRAAGFAATVLAGELAPAGRSNDQDYLRRLGVAGFAAANIMLLSVSVWSGHGNDMPASLQTLFHWLSALIALPAVAYAGQPFFASAVKALSARRLNMDVPISLGVVLATGMSLFQTIRGSEQVYFDAAITLLFFLLIGRALDQSMRQRAASAAENLLGLRSPTTSVIAADGTVARVPTNEVSPGTRILIAAGERIPVDARVLSGRTEIDESLITGESRPRIATSGDRLYCGTINLAQPIEAEATAVADNTLLAEIGRLVATAEQTRGLYVRIADRAARFYAPAVHILGAGTFIGWMLAGQGWEAALTTAIAVLIITCPCALALAVPAVQVVATGRLFRNGVLLKASDGLERLAEVDTIVLDKTGTLTLGEPRIVDAAAIPSPALIRAAGLATHSHHPYARAVVRAAQDRGLAVPALDGVTEVPGAGLVAIVDGTEIRLGSLAHCDAAGENRDGQSLWFRDLDGKAQAFALTDPLRPDAPDVVAALSRRGYAIEILSGDEAAAVSDAARQTGIIEWRAGQRPGDKISRIAELTASGRKVLMIGDGLNDAPALAAGHASMSPASAADVSQTAADGLFQGQALWPIAETLTVAKAARRRALENFAIALGYNVIFVPLAMAGQVTPLIAAIAMSASSIAVTANALRMARREREVSP